MTKTFKVMAYVTAYEDQEALSLCLNAILRQSYPVSDVLIVDNSHVQLAQNDPDHGISVIHCPENIGVAGGLKLAFSTAAAMASDFVWTFDQDSTPAGDCLENLIACYCETNAEALERVGIISPLAIDVETNSPVGGATFDKFRFVGVLPLTDAPFVACDAPITSGSLVSLAAIKAGALPKEELFMDAVDLDLGVQVRRAGFRNVISKRATMRHHLGSPLNVKLANKKYTVRDYSSLRNYYLYRNHTYVELINTAAPYKLLCIARRLYLAVKGAIGTVLFRRNKVTTIKAICLGTWDGLRGKLGKIAFRFE